MRLRKAGLPRLLAALLLGQMALLPARMMAAPVHGRPRFARAHQAAQAACAAVPARKGHRGRKKRRDWRRHSGLMCPAPSLPVSSKVALRAGEPSQASPSSGPPLDHPPAA